MNQLLEATKLVLQNPDNATYRANLFKLIEQSKQISKNLADAIKSFLCCCSFLIYTDPQRKNFLLLKSVRPKKSESLNVQKQRR